MHFVPVQYKVFIFVLVKLSKQSFNHLVVAIPVYVDNHICKCSHVNKTNIWISQPNMNFDNHDSKIVFCLLQLLICHRSILIIFTLLL